MPPRVPPTACIHAEIDALFNSDLDLVAVSEGVGRLTVRLVMQRAIEAEVDALLGRGRYERRAEDAPSGSRNGICAASSSTNRRNLSTKCQSPQRHSLSSGPTARVIYTSTETPPSFEWISSDS